MALSSNFTMIFFEFLKSNHLQRAEYYSYCNFGSLSNFIVLIVTKMTTTCSGSKAIFALFINSSKRAHVFALDTVRTNQMPNMTQLYKNEYKKRYFSNKVNKLLFSLLMTHGKWNYPKTLETAITRIAIPLYSILVVCILAVASP